MTAWLDRSHFRSRTVTRHAGVLGAGTLTLLAAVLRVPTLDRQSFWSDEAITALLTRMSFGEMLRVIPQTESTPPVYYVVAWLWARGFGDGEIGLRSLSALAGVATVPVAYVAGTALMGRRVGLAAAALVAVSPSLVWYSQEARSYALATLLCGASFAAFARVLSSRAMSPLALWSTFSVLAIWTHYFAVFVVAAEAAWLLLSSSGKTARRAVAATALGGVAVLPLALEQRANGFTELFGPSDRLSGRVIVVAKQLLVGQALPADRVVAGLAALIVAGSLACIIARGSRANQHAVVVAATVGGAAFVLPIALAIGGFDYVNMRNTQMGMVPLFVAAVAGLVVAAPRPLGAVAFVGLCGVLAAATIVVSADASYHRDDWRGLADGLARPDVTRALIVTPDHQGWFARVPLQLYRPEARAIDSGLTSTPSQFARVSRRPRDHAAPRTVVLQELVIAGVGWGIDALPPSLADRFRLVEDRRSDGYHFRRYRSERPVDVPTKSLVLPLSVVVVEEPRRP
jgi:mannosyltransferase